MKLSLRQKQIFYHQLGQLLRSGIPFSRALETLGRQSGGSVRRLVDRLREAAGRGAAVADAFATQVPLISEMEASVMGACERSGRLDESCRYLSDYFTALDQSRRTVIRKSAYPLFMLHIGIFVLALPRLFLESSAAYLRNTFGVLLVVYACAAAAWFAGTLLVRAGATRTSIDVMLRSLPVAGKIRRAFALARFCATYEIQLHAGVNVLDSLESASHASQSALVNGAVRNALSQVRGGEKVAPQLGRSNAFTIEMIRSLEIAEETGNLDSELKRLADDFQHEAVARLEIFSEWMPKIIYVSILLFLGYQIISLYQGILQSYGKFLE